MARICFVGTDNYPILNPAYGERYIGGESVQQTLLAKALRGFGHSVSTVVGDFGQPDGECIDGIDVWKTMRKDAGLPILRFVHPRLTSVMRALSNADADIYYQSCAGVLTGFVAWFCRRRDRRFVFRVAHDSDCIPGRQLIRYARDRKIYEYGLRRADLIVAQTDYQSELLRQHYDLPSVTLNMVVEQPEESTRSEPDVDVLWVNNLRPFKRPELFLDLAQRLPAYRFVMIGGSASGHESLYDSIRERAAGITNLDFLGFVPYHEIHTHYERARVFVNTSDEEGFPNSFLQAWLRGVPVISFFDPDGIIAAESLGRCPQTLDELAVDVESLLDDPEARRVAGNRARRFAVEGYSPPAIARRYDELFRNLHFPAQAREPAGNGDVAR